jgi:hypothetical protein
MVSFTPVSGNFPCSRIAETVSAVPAMSSKFNCYDGGFVFNYSQSALWKRLMLRALYIHVIGQTMDDCRGSIRVFHCRIFLCPEQ